MDADKVDTATVPAEAGAGESAATAATTNVRATTADESVAYEEAFKVFVRIRPPLGEEITQPQAIEATGHNTLKLLTDKHEVKCSYDKVLTENVSQAEIYEEIAPRVRAVLSGKNSTIFAYGQTGSGKTFTMLGKDLESQLVQGKPISQTDTEDWGVIPRAIVDIFTCLNNKTSGEEDSECGDGQYTQESGKSAEMNAIIHCSYMQIYNNQLFDLLADPSRTNKLQIRESVGFKGKKTEIFVQGLSEYRVSSASDVLLLLQHGSRNRAVRATQYNEQSSRSHAILQMSIETSTVKPNGSRVVRVAKLNCVDLAGSEKWNTWTQMKKKHQKELTEINTSLSALGICIQRLTEAGHQHVPYRDSVLTRLLEDSLGGNTMTCVIATVSPTVLSAENSMSTLQFADRARQVMVRVKPNQIVDNKQKLVSAEREIARLKNVVETLRQQLKEAGVEPRTFDQAMIHQENIQLKEENTRLRQRIDDMAYDMSSNKMGKRGPRGGGKSQKKGSKRSQRSQHATHTRIPPIAPVKQGTDPASMKQVYGHGGSRPSGVSAFPPVLSSMPYKQKSTTPSLFAEGDNMSGSAADLIKPLTARSNQEGDGIQQQRQEFNKENGAPNLTRAMVGIARAREKKESIKPKQPMTLLDYDRLEDEEENDEEGEAINYSDDWEDHDLDDDLDDDDQMSQTSSEMTKGMPGCSAFASRLDQREQQEPPLPQDRGKGPESYTPQPHPTQKASNPYALKQKMPKAMIPKKKKTRKKKKSTAPPGPISSELAALHNQMMQDVGKRIRVHFARYDEWYKGTIVGIDAERRMHCIEYDHGERKWCKMDMRKYQLLKKKGTTSDAPSVSSAPPARSEMDPGFSANKADIVPHESDSMMMMHM